MKEITQRHNTKKEAVGPLLGVEGIGRAKILPGRLAMMLPLLLPLEKWGKMGKMGENGEKWGKMGKNGEKWGKMGENGGEMGGNGGK